MASGNNTISLLSCVSLRIERGIGAETCKNVNVYSAFKYDITIFKQEHFYCFTYDNEKETVDFKKEHLLFFYDAPQFLIASVDFNYYFGYPASVELANKTKFELMASIWSLLAENDVSPQKLSAVGDYVLYFYNCLCDSERAELNVKYYMNIKNLTCPYYKRVMESNCIFGKGYLQQEMCSIVEKLVSRLVKNMRVKTSEDVVKMLLAPTELVSYKIKQDALGNGHFVFFDTLLSSLNYKTLCFLTKSPSPAALFEKLKLIKSDSPAKLSSDHCCAAFAIVSRFVEMQQFLASFKLDVLKRQRAAMKPKTKISYFSFDYTSGTAIERHLSLFETRMLKSFFQKNQKTCDVSKASRNRAISPRARWGSQDLRVSLEAFGTPSRDFPDAADFQTGTLSPDSIADLIYWTKQKTVCDGKDFNFPSCEWTSDAYSLDKIVAHYKQEKMKIEEKRRRDRKTKRDIKKKVDLPKPTSTTCKFVAIADTFSSTAFDELETGRKNDVCSGLLLVRHDADLNKAAETFGLKKSFVPLINILAKTTIQHYKWYHATQNHHQDDKKRDIIGSGEHLNVLSKRTHVTSTLHYLLNFFKNNIPAVQSLPKSTDREHDAEMLKNLLNKWDHASGEEKYQSLGERVNLARGCYQAHENNIVSVWHQIPPFQLFFNNVLCSALEEQNMIVTNTSSTHTTGMSYQRQRANMATASILEDHGHTRRATVSVENQHCDLKIVTRREKKQTCPLVLLLSAKILYTKFLEKFAEEMFFNECVDEPLLTESSLQRDRTGRDCTDDDDDDDDDEHFRAVLKKMLGEFVTKEQPPEALDDS